jgi:hypothetical protein
MSNNAVAAYDAGLLTASKLAPILNARFGVKVNAAWIKARLAYEEKHHCSSKFNLVEFYSAESAIAEIEGNPALLASAHDYTAATKAALANRTEYVADVRISEWVRVQINRFGKLAWKKNVRTVTGVTVKPIGVSFVEISGEGKLALKNLTINKIDAAELLRRKRAAAGVKAAATRKMKLAKLELAEKITAMLAAPKVLQLVEKTESSRIASQTEIEAAVREIVSRPGWTRQDVRRAMPQLTSNHTDEIIFRVRPVFFSK